MVLASWLLATWALVGQVEAAPPADMAASVRRLLVDLDAPEKPRRDTAERQLVELGPAALAYLPEVGPELPAEMTLRLGRVRGQLERAQTDAAVQASTVTLTGQNLPFKDVLAALEKQTGNKLRDFRPQFGEELKDLTVNAQFNKTPFWEALDAVLDQTGLTIYNFAGEEGLALVGRPTSQRPRVDRADYAGAFRIEATDFIAHRDLRDPSSHTLQLNIEAAWEPRLHPIIILQPAGVVEARDEQGRPLTLVGADNELEINVNPGSHSVDLPLHLALPPRSVNRIASLKGKLTAVLPGRAEDFRFDNLEKAKRVVQRRAGVTVTLDEAWKNNAIWEIRVRVTFDQAGGALESHRNWIFNNEAWLEAPDKEKVANAGLETTRQTDNEVGIAYLFGVPDTLAGYTFVYRTPAAIATVPVAYELKDLELP
jgi:hypothetical protein